MNTSVLARELESKFSQTNFFVSRGNYQNLLGTAPNSAHLEALLSDYLALTDDIKNLVYVLKSEIETARKNYIPGDAQY